MRPIAEDPDTLAYHVMLRLADGRVLGTSSRAMRLAAEVIHRQGVPRGLLAFRVADTHVHALLATRRLVAAAFANYAESSLGWRLDLSVGFDRARILPIRTHAHLARALPYVLRQEQRHGTRFDPANEGSALPDLVGLRVAEHNPWAEIVKLLPRLRRCDVLDIVDWSQLDTWPIGFDHLRAATAAAGPARSKACVAALQIGAVAFEVGALADVLQLHRATVHRLRRVPTDPRYLRAVELQLRLRQRLFGCTQASETSKTEGVTIFSGRLRESVSAPAP